MFGAGASIPRRDGRDQRAIPALRVISRAVDCHRVAANQDPKGRRRVERQFTGRSIDLPRVLGARPTASARTRRDRHALRRGRRPVAHVVGLPHGQFPAQRLDRGIGFFRRQIRPIANCRDVAEPAGRCSSVRRITPSGAVRTSSMQRRTAQRGPRDRPGAPAREHIGAGTGLGPVDGSRAYRGDDGRGDAARRCSQREELREGAAIRTADSVDRSLNRSANPGTRGGRRHVRVSPGSHFLDEPSASPVLEARRRAAEKGVSSAAAGAHHPHRRLRASARSARPGIAAPRLVQACPGADRETVPFRRGETSFDSTNGRSCRRPGPAASNGAGRHDTPAWRTSPEETS